MLPDLSPSDARYPVLARLAHLNVGAYREPHLAVMQQLGRCTRLRRLGLRRITFPCAHVYMLRRSA